MKRLLSVLSLLIVFTLVFTGCDADSFLSGLLGNDTTVGAGDINVPSTVVDINSIPEYSDKAYIAINGNEPAFTKDELTTESYEFYSELDSLGRCGYTMACVGRDIMPTEDRGSIGQVKPTGWQTVKYDIVDGKYLYNRCHLIGFQLTGENANTKNLITGTRYLNIDGMLDFENMIADYVKETGNHVLYRVTPIFKGNELVARGVQMEAYSVEDDGEGICFNVYAYNVQPGVVIDYATGVSALAGEKLPTVTTKAPIAGEQSPEQTYILNTNSDVFHLESCSSVTSMSEHNRVEYIGSREAIINEGYNPCGRCKP